MEPSVTPDPLPPTLATQEELFWAMIAHLLGLANVTLLGVIGPLVIYFVMRDRSRFVAFHALQSTYFELAELVVLALVTVLTVITCGVLWPLALLVPLAAIIYKVVAAIQAFEGKWFEYIVVGPIARRQVMG